LFKVRISISKAYFSAVETMADFFNRIDPKPPFAKNIRRSKAVNRPSAYPILFPHLPEHMLNGILIMVILTASRWCALEGIFVSIEHGRASEWA
jgi:hypothetical protein